MGRKTVPIILLFGTVSCENRRLVVLAASADERKPRCMFHVGDRVRVTSDAKPFKGATGIIRAVEQEGWRLAPYFLYRVELAVGLVGYECGELE